MLDLRLPRNAASRPYLELSTRYSPGRSCLVPEALSVRIWCPCRNLEHDIDLALSLESKKRDGMIRRKGDSLFLFMEEDQCFLPRVDTRPRQSTKEALRLYIIEVDSAVTASHLVRHITAHNASPDALQIFTLWFPHLRTRGAYFFLALLEPQILSSSGNMPRSH